MTDKFFKVLGESSLLKNKSRFLMICRKDTLFGGLDDLYRSKDKFFEHLGDLRSIKDKVCGDLDGHHSRKNTFLGDLEEEQVL